MRRFFSLGVAVLVAACAGSDQSIDDTALVSEPSGENWLAFGRELNEQRFSPLRQIDTSNVASLKVDNLADEQLLALRHYIRQRTEAALAAPPK